MGAPRLRSRARGQTFAGALEGAIAGPRAAASFFIMNAFACAWIVCGTFRSRASSLMSLSCSVYIIFSAVGSGTFGFFTSEILIA